MQIEVDNEILAALIDAHFGVKHKISLNSEKKNITEAYAHGGQICQKEKFI